MKKRTQQQELHFTPRKPLVEHSPCEAANLTPEQWQRAGFPRDFNQHRYCQRIYTGWRDAEGVLHKCECLCHPS